MKETKGDTLFVEERSTSLVRIAHAERLAPFLTTLTSDTDLWLFASSTGAFTAGRADPDGAVVPYETEDRLHEGYGRLGPITLIRCRRDGAPAIDWEPFDPRRPPGAEAIAKSITSDELRFERQHATSALEIEVTLRGCERFGFVRSVRLRNTGPSVARLEICDGLVDVLPAGVALSLQQRASVLVDAYRHGEIDEASGLGVFALSSMITDRAEPAEALTANVVWTRGLPTATLTLARDAVGQWRQNEIGQSVHRLTGVKAGFLARAEMVLGAGEEKRWLVVFDACRDRAEVGQLREWLLATDDPMAVVERELDRARASLSRTLAAADPQQSSAEPAVVANHASNVLFNVMRGGVFVDDGRVPATDLAAAVRRANRGVFQRHRGWLESLPDGLEPSDLLERARQQGELSLVRLCLEFLPLTFSRRHGDPSRPWNRFRIQVRDDAGARTLRYEGNWRDIFQNWEALAWSFPAFLPGMVARFVNASTVDGYNPYRISSEGIDWEVPDPDDPWPNFGYWGDHQLIYLLRLLELLTEVDPEQLRAMLHEPWFSYAEVPYRLHDYHRLLADPRDSIDFDADLDREIARRVDRVGSDGRLVPDADDGILHVTLLEKLLVSALAKLANLVVAGGVWMNTQRPEWNDANNALAGPGLSVVTAAHLRAYLGFVAELIGREPCALSERVAIWLEDTVTVLDEHRDVIGEASLSDELRRRVLDRLGESFATFRQAAYAGRGTALGTVPAARVERLCRLGIHVLDATLDASRREDGLYHAYNLLTVGEDSAAVTHLYPMLEGQVAAVESGRLAAGEVIELIDATYASPLYREDQDSFMLYPDRDLPGFLARNQVARDRALAVPALAEHLARHERSIVIDGDDPARVHFAPGLVNARALEDVLERLAVDAADRRRIHALYEQAFDHARFTGRSGGMYAYEGLGSIYWHMVAKLLLAVQRVHARAVESEEVGVVAELVARYYRVRAGLNFNKSPEQYGAFPTDAYSHTPKNAGARQPGMTGQVKEQILLRWGELGVRPHRGRLRFAPTLLKRTEVSDRARAWRWLDCRGEWQEDHLPPSTLAFTYCHTPVVYTFGDHAPAIAVLATDGSRAQTAGYELDPDWARRIFRRDRRVARLEVELPAERLLE